jgi:diguanylate cyclase (GGDEF)-like protein/PAS domain S-box-containing protein
MPEKSKSAPQKPRAAPGVGLNAWVLADSAWGQVFENSPEAMGLTRESDQVIVAVNTEWCRVTGFERANVLGRTALQLGLWQSGEARSRVMATLASAGRVVDADIDMVVHDGLQHVMRLSITRLTLDGVCYLLVCMRDVTPERMAYAALQASESALENKLAFINKITARAPGMVYEYQVWPDKRYSFPFVSAGVQSVLGISAARLQAEPELMGQVIHPQDSELVFKTTQAAFHKLEPWSCEFRINLPHDEVRWVFGQSLPELQPDGSVLFCGAMTDVTAQKHAQAQLERSEQRFRKLTALSSDWYWEQDADFRFVDTQVDVRMAETLQVSSSWYVGKTRWDSGALGVSDAQWDAHKAQLLAHETFHGFEMQRLRENGTWMWVSVSGEPIFDAQGTFTGYRGIGRDISARKASEAEIERLAFFDSLTALPNRRLLLDRLSHALATSVRHGSHGALLFIDLDNFKTLNDTLGHHLGDLLLQQVALRLLACGRATDTVARLGGDEFVIMLEELGADAVDAAAQAESIAKKVLLALNMPFNLNGNHVNSSPSVGVTLFYRQNTDVDELLKRADLAMYQAKSAGRNTVRFFDPGMQEAATKRATMENDLRLGLQRKEFLLYYQPVVNAQGVPIGVEALARWKHPQRGMVSPAEFIPVAEQTGLILSLGQWVLESACAQLVVWAAQPQTQSLSIAVNVSARQFKHPDFAAQVLLMLRQTGANPYRLKLEITESLLLADFEDVIDKMSELRAIGVSFSLDDFGTGYSSLAYLKRLPLDQLKIDQSFVRDVLTDPNDAAIARTILSLAQSLDLSAVAEGVETAAQFEFLRSNGCKLFQGYYFSRPVPLESLNLNPPQEPGQDSSDWDI